MASIINAATSGGLITTADTSGILQLQTAGTTAVTVDASQNVTVVGSLTAAGLSGPHNGTVGATTPSTVVATTVKASTTMGVGGATPSASGSGITFPATQSASTDANTLDDYEEGTFTPTFSATSVTFTLAASTVATYTKVGRVVSFSIYFQVASVSGSTGNATTITGLPFTSSNVTADNMNSVYAAQLYNVGTVASAFSSSIYIRSNSSIINLFWNRAANTDVAWTAANLTAGGSSGIMLSGSYIV